MPVFKTINYSTTLKETLRAYHSVNTSGGLSYLYKFCLCCLYVLQLPFNNFHLWRIRQQLIANCKWQIGQLTNVLNMLYDATLKRIFIGQSSTIYVFEINIDEGESTVFEHNIDDCNVYACVSGLGGIYMQTGGAGNFVSLAQPNRPYQSMATSTAGNVYACVYGGDIYMQTGGVGNFIALGQTPRNWFKMCASPNSNVYACEFNGDIYMQTAGAGNFVALSQTNRDWFGMAASPNGNIYACVAGGDIYMQTAGAGNFVALSQTTRNWFGMAASPNGNMYACVTVGDIYMQTGGSGNFVGLSQTSRNWFGMTGAPNGNIYCCISGGDIYMQTNGTGNFVGLSQTHRTWQGMTALSKSESVIFEPNIDDASLNSSLVTIHVPASVFTNPALMSQLVADIELIRLKGILYQIVTP